MRDLLRIVRDTGFSLPNHLIHLFVGGSELHGAKLKATDDMDIYGLYLEPPELALGLERAEHFVWSTAGNERRNTADDVDVTLYSLRKWAGLAAKGNPTALHFLFVEPDPAITGAQRKAWLRVRNHRDAFLARSCSPQFVGFADAQLKRLTGERGRGKKGQRPELEQEHGYDTKAAMHTMRLLGEGLELLQTGTITLPRPERDALIQIRSGKYSLEKFLNMSKPMFREFEKAVETSPLPEKVDRASVSKLVAETYVEYWKSQSR